MNKIISMLKKEGAPNIKIIFLCFVASLMFIACGSSGGGGGMAMTMEEVLK